jgi:hypothetical protein
VITRQVQRLTSLLLAAAGAFAASLLSAPALAQDSDATLVRDVLKTLNDDDSIKGPESAKLYKMLFDAYLDLSKPPFEISPSFNLNTIFPKMTDWKTVSGWAESNATMADAIIKCKDPKFTKVGLPYGRDGLDAKYTKAGIAADVGVSGSLRHSEFPYFDAMDAIAAFATAESYRLLEAGQTQKALDLYVAMAFVVRQFCDREFLAEKTHFVAMLSNVMENMRDMFYAYQDKITADEFIKIAQQELPFLRPDRGRLFMPEADRVVAEALIKEVFDSSSQQVDAEKFASTFAEVQSKDAPLTRFGAARRWSYIANIHSPVQESLDRLQLVYDDWWRRWRIDQYDETLLSVPTQFTRTNPIRYAAVIYSLENLSNVFAIRNTLVADVNGTAVVAGLCGYKKTFGTYPDSQEKTYTQFMRKPNDSDPFDKLLRAFKYKLLSSRQAVEVDGDTIWIEAGEALLYSQGQDHEDGRAATHSTGGVEGDMLIWPPIKVLARAQVPGYSGAQVSAAAETDGEQP